MNDLTQAMDKPQSKVFCLNPRYSTTRTLTEERPKIDNSPEAKWHPQLFLPSHPDREDEGGLRTKGYFKRNLKDSPVVTIITIVHNGAEYIEKTIESVLNQTYNNVEYIIIDGDSTDGTTGIIKRYEQAVDYWVSEPDSGISEAFNKGVIASRGKWLNFMNCGDTFASGDTIQDVVANIDEKADVIFGKANVVDSDGKTLLTYGRPFDKKNFSRRMTIPHQSAFHNKKYFERHGLFDKRLKTGMDYELLLRKPSLSTLFIEKTVSNILVGGVSETDDYLRLRNDRMIKRKYCSDIGDLIIEFDYWYGLGRALIKRALNRVGLRSITRKIRQIESRFR
jgi:glycosyltransferase involved in cell wall biosynthesis